MNIRKFRAAFLTLTVAAIVAVPALAAQTASEKKSETPTAASEQTTVRVVNDNWNDITVYAFRDGYRRRLGTVSSFTNRVFALPRTFLIPSSNFRLIADPIGPRGVYGSEALVISDGDVIEWRLRNNIRLSNIFIYNFRGEGL